MPELEQLAGAVDTTPSFQISSANLQHFLNHLNRYVGEAKLELANGQLNAHVIDPAHVAMAKASSPVIQHEGGETTIGVDVDLLKSLLKPVPIAHPDPIKVEIHDQRLTVTVGRYEYELGLLDTSGMTEPKPPNLDLPCRFTIKARDWSNWIKRAKKVSDHCRITVNQDGVTALAIQGRNGARVQADLDVETSHAERQASSLFSMDYLDAHRKAASFQGEASFWIGQDFPLRYEVRPAELVCRGMLEPRIEGA